MNPTTILIIVSVFAAISIIALVLMQQSKGDMGSAFGGGGSQSMFGSLTVLFVSCLALAYIYAKRNSQANVIETIQVEETSEVPSISDSVEETSENSEVPEIPSDSDTSELAPDSAEIEVPTTQEEATPEPTTQDAPASEEPQQ